jgi:hypothetical protein
VLGAALRTAAVNGWNCHDHAAAGCASALNHVQKSMPLPSACYFLLAGQSSLPRWLAQRGTRLVAMGLIALLISITFIVTSRFVNSH